MTRSAAHRVGPQHPVIVALALTLQLGMGTAARAQVAGQPPAAQAAVQPAGQPPAAQPLGDPALDAMKQRDQELQAILSEQKRAAETQQRLRDEIEAIGEDRRKLNQALIDAATRVRSVEGRIAVAEQRLQRMDENEAKLRHSLEARRGTIAEVLAALQRIGRRPLPAVLVRPEDALVSVRTAIMLGAVLPDMKHEAEGLAGDLGELVKVRQDIASERDKLAHDLASISEDRQRMSLLIEGRQKRQGEVEQQLEVERTHAGQLARQADNLKDLIAKLEQNLDSVKRAAVAADRATQEAKLTPESRPSLSALKDPGRLSPAIAFMSAKKQLPMPVNGVKIRDFGGSDGLGGTEKGLVVGTRGGAQVTSPCDGWVVYAGPFRSYGQLLILNAGGGYHVLLAGMERMSVDLGQFVLTGEPVAVMGDAAKVASAIGAGSRQPVLYIEFRKDGSPVDPSPWWATNDSEKVRG
jgi:murein hydrolase activator